MCKDMNETWNVSFHIDDESMRENAFVNGRNEDIVPWYPAWLSKNPIWKVSEFEKHLLEIFSEGKED